jgi:hypothetical protein
VLVAQAAHSLAAPGCIASDAIKAARRLLREDRQTRLGMLWARARADGADTVASRLSASLADASVAGVGGVCARAAFLEDHSEDARALDPLVWHDHTSALVQSHGFHPLRHRRMLDTALAPSLAEASAMLAASLDCTIGLDPAAAEVLKSLEEHIPKLGGFPMEIPLSLHAWHCMSPPTK